MSTISIINRTTLAAILSVIGCIHLNAQTATRLYGDQKTPYLIQAANLGDVDDVKTFIYEQKYDVNTRTDTGVTALIAAAQHGHLAVVKVLIEANADVNIHATDGRTALIMAVTNGHSQIVKELLIAKANPNQKMVTNGQTALLTASILGNVDIVQILLNANADVDVRSMKGVTPLIYAAEKGHAEVVEMLLKAGAGVDAKANDGNTALMAAAWAGKVEVAKILIKTGAKINNRRTEGQTALMDAAFQGHLEMVKLLLERGANVELTTSDGMSAGKLAKLNGHNEIAALLDGPSSSHNNFDFAQLLSINTALTTNSINIGLCERLKTKAISDIRKKYDIKPAKAPEQIIEEINSDQDSVLGIMPVDSETDGKVDPDRTIIFLFISHTVNTKEKLLNWSKRLVDICRSADAFSKKHNALITVIPFIYKDGKILDGVASGQQAKWILNLDLGNALFYLSPGEKYVGTERSVCLSLPNDVPK